MTIRCQATQLWTSAALLGCVAFAAGCSDGAPTPSDPVANANTVILQRVSGDAQISTAGSDLPSPLVVRVTDSRGKPIFRPVPRLGDRRQRSTRP